MVIILMLVYVVLTSTQVMCNKVYQLKVKTTAPTYMVFLLSVSISAFFTFFALSGFSFTVDSKVFVYGFICCLQVIACMLCMLLSMATANIPTVTVAQNAGNLVLPTLYGFLFLGEAFTLMRFIGIVLIMAAFLVPFFAERNTGDKKNSAAGIICCILLFITSGAGNVINKAFTVSGSVASNATYLTVLNLFMAPMVATAFFVLKAKRKQNFHDFIGGVKVTNFIYPGAGAIIGAFGMVCGMRVMRMMDIAILSPIYSALVIVFLVAASRFVFKEKITKVNYISIALALLSVAVTALA